MIGGKHLVSFLFGNVKVSDILQVIAQVCISILVVLSLFIFFFYAVGFLNG